MESPENSAAAAVIVVAAAAAPTVVAAAAAAPAEEYDEDNDYPQNTVVIAAIAEHIYIPFPVPKIYLRRRHGVRRSIRPGCTGSGFYAAHAILCRSRCECYVKWRTSEYLLQEENNAGRY